MEIDISKIIEKVNNNINLTEYEIIFLIDDFFPKLNIVSDLLKYRNEKYMFLMLINSKNKVYFKEEMRLNKKIIKNIKNLKNDLKNIISENEINSKKIKHIIEIYNLINELIEQKKDLSYIKIKNK